MKMWTIKFDNGEWSYLDPGFLAPRRTDAWAKWAKEWNYSPRMMRDALRDRRKGWYRAVRVEIVEITTQPAPAAELGKDQQ